MPVNSQNKQYQAKVLQWAQVDDCINDRVKEKQKLYLPDPESEVKSGSDYNGSEQRYKDYLMRAMFMNVVKRTHDGFLGSVFRMDSTVELPSNLEYLEASVNSTGMPLDQFAKAVESEGIKTGRCFVLTEYPNVQGETAQTKADSAGRKASLIAYDAKNVINWQTTDGKLSLIVIEQTYDTGKGDEFSPDVESEYLVLRYRGGEYTQQIYRDENPATEEIIIKQSDGSNWDFIPGVFIGTVNNLPDVDPSFVIQHKRAKYWPL